MLRRGAPLLKYCRNAKPHVSHFQLSADEARLEWVGKNAKTKGVPMDAVAEVIPGRTSEVFRKWSSLRDEHPPEVCLSVRYEEEASRTRKAKTKRYRTLDLVFEDPARAAVWREGLVAARRRARADSSGPDAAPQKSSGSSDALARGANGTNGAQQTSATAPLAMRAASRFERLGSASAGGAAGDAASRERIAEPGDVFVWGRVAAADGGGAFGAFGDTSGFAADARNELAPECFATPRRVAGTDGIDVVALALGASHAAAVVRGRGVYTWGEGRGGRLGHGSHAARATPTRLRGAAVETAGLGGERGVDEDVLSVCCGGSVTFAVSGNGRCFAWGDAEGGSASVFGGGEDAANAFGTSGVSAARWTPAPVRFPGVSGGGRARRVTSVSASRSHVAALAADGSLFTWGEDAFGALGVGRRADEDVGDARETTGLGLRENARAAPTLVAALAGKRVTSVSCGRWHTAAVADGEVFAWGDAEGGKLGRPAVPEAAAGAALPGRSSGGDGATRARRTPSRVTREPFPEPVARVSCGTWHTLFLTTGGALYVLGAVGGRDVAGSVEETPARVPFDETRARKAGDGDDPGSPGRLACALVASGELHAAAVVVATGVAAATPSRSSVAARRTESALPDAASVYTWGSGKRGALGHGDVLDRPFPKRVAALAGRGARRVTCGPDATACVVAPRRATNREKASVAKAGARLTRRFDASSRGGLGVRDGVADAGDGGASGPRAAAASARASETRGIEARVSREGSKRGGSVGGGGRDSLVAGDEIVRDGSVTETARRSGSAFATPRPIGPGARADGEANDASLADTAAAASLVAAARARRDAASAAAERDALRLEVASLRAALRLAERADGATTTRATDGEPSVSGRVVLPAPGAAIAEASREEAGTLAVFARGGDRDEPTPPVAATPVVAATAVPPVAATPRTPLPRDAGDSDVGTPNTPADAPERPGTESRRPAPSPSPSPSPCPTTPGSSSGTPGSQWVEEIEPGVFMTIACDATTGHHVLRRVRFSKRVFSDTEATAWWTKNRARVVRARGLKVSR